MLGKTGLSLATSPYPFGYELSRFFLFQFSTINFFFSCSTLSVLSQSPTEGREYHPFVL